MKFRFIKNIQAMTTCMLLLMFASLAQAEGYALRVGPVSVGNGGSNPVGIPPGGSDLELGVWTKSGFEMSLGVPCLCIGGRSETKWGGYLGLGGALVIDSSGIGPGVYYAMGIQRTKGLILWGLEYKAAVGIGSKGFMLPYSLRASLALWRD